MKRLCTIAGMILAGASLAGCTTTLWGPSDEEHRIAAQQAPIQDTGRPVGASIRAEGRPLPQDSGPQGTDLAAVGDMSGADRAKLAHALDSPPGKTSNWINTNSGVSYSVTPIRKVTINNNHLCRVYTSTAMRNGQKQEITGTACIGDDGAWHKI